MTAPAYDRWGVTVHEGDCLDVLRQFPDEHFAAVVTDPPYSYRFMNKIWDAHESPLAFQQWCEGWARECLRVLKPGGIMLSFGGTRTSHRLTCGIEDAGFEIRDSIDWLYAGGMPKGINISKEIDRIAGAEREVIGTNVYGDGHVQRSTESIGYGGCDPATDTRLVTAPATDAARQWEGWNTQLRPAHEPIVVARKPFRGTVAGNVLEHGTGGLHVDATRVAANGRKLLHTVTHGPATPGTSTFATGLSRPSYLAGYTDQGRYPPNVVLSHVPSVDPATGEVVGDACAQGCVDGCVVAELDQQSGVQKDGVAVNRNRPSGTMSSWYGQRASQTGADVGYGGEGGASRFFPCFRFEAKAPTAERPRVAGESHSTVKPLALMRWLVRLVTPPGGTVLDCFAGTGVTGQAARAEGFPAVLIDSDPAAIPWIVARLDAHPREDKPTTAQPAARQAHPDLFDGPAS